MSTRKNTILPWQVKTCYLANVPEDHRTTGFDGDLVIYLTSQNNPGEGFVAWAV